MPKLQEKLHELKRARATIHAKRVSLNKSRIAILEKEGDMSDDDSSRLESIERDIEEHGSQLTDHDDRIAKCERALDMEGDGSEPVDEPVQSTATPATAKTGYDPRNPWGFTNHGTGEPPVKEGKGLKAARFAIGVLLAKQSGFANAAQMIERRFGDKDVAKALNTAGVATGGALIPQGFSTEIIELLRAATVIRASDPTVMDMPLGNMTIPRLAGGATAGYQGELDDMSSSQETFDDLQLNAKKLTALVPVSNDLLRRAPANLESIVRDDMVQSLARREDLAFMLGDGSGGSPIGLLNLCAATSKLIVAPFTATDNATVLTAVVGTLLSMRLLLTNNMSRMIRPRWIMTPTTEAFLMGLRDQVGNFVYKEEMTTRGTLDGIPYKITQQLPTNITANLNGGGTANNGAYLFLADFADVILAETYHMAVDASDVASYKDSGGNMVSAFTRDQTAFRIIEEHDFNIRHQASVAVALLPAWAPAGWTNYGAGFAYYTQAPSNDMSAAPSTWGVAAPTGSNNPGNVGANVPGGLLPGRP